MNKFSNVIGTTPSTTLFIGDLSIVCTASDLEALFARYHAVNIEIERDSRFVAYGFVSFASVQQAGFAMHHLNGTMMFGRNLRIGWASKEKGAAVKYLTVDIHFSFIAKQANLLVFELTVRELLFELGCSSVVDVEFKSYTVQPNSSQHFGNGFIRLDPSPQSVHMAKRLCTQLKQLSVDRVVVFDFGQGNTLSGLLTARPDLAQLWHSLDGSMRSTGMVNHMNVGAELSYASPQQMERFLTSKKVQTAAHRPRPTINELVASNAFGTAPSLLRPKDIHFSDPVFEQGRVHGAHGLLRGSNHEVNNLFCSASNKGPRHSASEGVGGAHHYPYYGMSEGGVGGGVGGGGGGVHQPMQSKVSNDHTQQNNPPFLRNRHGHHEQHPSPTIPGQHNTNYQQRALQQTQRYETQRSSPGGAVSLAEQSRARQEFFGQFEAEQRNQQQQQQVVEQKNGGDEWW